MSLSVRATAAPAYTLAVALRVILPDADVEAAKDVVRGAHTLCPYSNATRNNIDVKLTVKPADGNDHEVDEAIERQTAFGRNARVRLQENVDARDDGLPDLVGARRLGAVAEQALADRCRRGRVR